VVLRAYQIELGALTFVCRCAVDVAFHEETNGKCTFKCLCGIFFDVLGGHCQTARKGHTHDLGCTPKDPDEVVAAELARMTVPWHTVSKWYIKTSKAKTPESFHKRSIALNKALGRTVVQAEQEEDDTLSYDSTATVRSTDSTYIRGYQGFMRRLDQNAHVQSRGKEEPGGGNSREEVEPSIPNPDPQAEAEKRASKACKDLGDALEQMLQCATKIDPSFMLGHDMIQVRNKVDLIGVVASSTSSQYTSLERAKMIRADLDVIKSNLSSAGIEALALMGDAER
jgi:hypothetical protein